MPPSSHQSLESKVSIRFVMSSLKFLNAVSKLSNLVSTLASLSRRSPSGSSSFGLRLAKDGAFYVGGLPPRASLRAKPIIPQSQKNMAKAVRYSSGTKPGKVAPAVPKARKNADKPSRKACILSLRPKAFTKLGLASESK